MPWGRTAVKKWQLRVDVVDGLDDVGAGLAEDDDEYGAGAIHIPGSAQVLRGVQTPATSERRIAAPL
jgi:hypothetical protein